MRKLSKSKAREFLLFSFALFSFAAAAAGAATSEENWPRLGKRLVENQGGGSGSGLFSKLHMWQAVNSFVKWQISLGQDSET